MDKALIGAIVGVGEEWGPAWRQAAHLHCKAMVLRRDEAALCVLMQAWLVVPTVSIPGQQDRCQAALGSQAPVMIPGPHSLHLVGVSTKGQGEQLVPQADPKDRLGLRCVQHLPQAGHCLLAELRVPGAITDEQSIKICAKTAAGSEWNP